MASFENLSQFNLLRVEFVYSQQQRRRKKIPGYCSKCLFADFAPIIESYSEHCQTIKMKLFATTVNGCKPLTAIFFISN